MSNNPEHIRMQGQTYLVSVWLYLQYLSHCIFSVGTVVPDSEDDDESSTSKWCASTNIFVTAHNNFSLHSSSQEMQEVFHEAERLLKLHVICTNAFVDLHVGKKTPFMHKLLLKAAKDFEYKAIVKRLYQDKPYARVLIEAVCIFLSMMFSSFINFFTS
jgi:hypothetical protein